MTFPVTYLKVVLPRLPPLQSTVAAPTSAHGKRSTSLSWCTLAETPTSQALLKEGALLQPAKHPLLPDSQYLWQVTLVQQKEFGSYEAHQTSRAIIPLTEAKANPLHSALQTDFACWKEAEQLHSTDFFQRIHLYFNEIGTVVSQLCLTRTAQSSCFITVDKIRFSKKCQATRCLFGQQLFAFSLLTNRFWFKKRS